MSEDQWFEPFRFEIEVIEVKSDCRADHKVKEPFRAEYRTSDPPICGEAYVGMYPLLFAMRVGGDMRHLGKEHPLQVIYTCPSRVVRFLIRGIPQCNHCGKDVESLSTLTRIDAPYPKFICRECASKHKSL